MKKLFLLTLLLFSIGCKAQKFEPAKPEIISVPLQVSYITDFEMGLFSPLTGKIIKTDPKDLDIEKFYWFWIELVPCNSCKIQSGRILLDPEKTPDQANRDIKEKEKIIRSNLIR